MQVDLPHWLDFILIGIVVTIIAELIRPNFTERMKSKSGKTYLIQQILLAGLIALTLSMVTNSTLICGICFIIAKGDAILNSMLYRALLLKQIITKDETGQDVLPLDSKSYSTLPVAEKILTQIGIKLHETRLTEHVDEQIATAESKAVATTIVLPDDIKKELENID